MPRPLHSKNRTKAIVRTQYQIRLNEAEHERQVEAAEKLGQRWGEWARNVLRAAAEAKP